MKGSLEKHIDAFMVHLPEMLKYHEGKWTVFYRGFPLGFYDSYKEAMKAGTDVYGLVDMLIRRVSNEYLDCGKYGKPRQLFGVSNPQSSQETGIELRFPSSEVLRKELKEASARIKKLEEEMEDQLKVDPRIYDIQFTI